MQESEHMDGKALAARLAALSASEREAEFPNHSDGTVCR
jgi:hypothetical protein